MFPLRIWFLTSVFDLLGTLLCWSHMSAEWRPPVSSNVKHIVLHCKVEPQPKLGPTIALLWEAFGEDTFHESTLWQWYRAFERGRKSAELQPSDGKLKTVVTEPNINTVAAVIAENCCLLMRTVSELLRIPRMPLQHILIKVIGIKICFHTFCSDFSRRATVSAFVKMVVSWSVFYVWSSF